MNLQWRSLAIPVKKAPRPVLGYLSDTELAHGLAQIDRLDAGRRRRRRRRRPPLHQATRSSRPGLRGCDGVGAVVRRERHRARRRGAVRLDDAIVGLTPCPQPAPATPPGSRLDGAGPFSLPGGGVSWSASSAESVGEFWFGQVAKCVIQSDFQCPGGAEPIRPFGDHSGLSVEAFDNATGELPPGSEPVQNQVAVRAQPCGQPPSSGRAASASSGCTSGRGTGRPSTATRSPTAIESPP